MPKLTPKQQRFADEYLLDCNATQAAIRAGYSSKTANEQGSRLLANVSIQKVLKQQISKRQKSANITQNDILNCLTKIGFKSFDEVEIAPKDSLKALELICRLLGLCKDNGQKMTDNGLSDAIDKSAERTWNDDVSKIRQEADENADMVGGANDIE